MAASLAAAPLDRVLRLESVMVSSISRGPTDPGSQEAAGAMQTACDIIEPDQSNLDCLWALQTTYLQC